ncbi:MAG: sodium:solute symporter family transporter [Planctomycetaceae bacterium]
MTSLPLLGAAAGLHVVDYGIVFVYLLLMIYIGWRCSRVQESAEDFFVGGRSMPWWATGLSLVATMMSTLTYLGVPGEVFGQGIGMLLQFISLPFAFLIIGWVWVPFFMKLRLTSAYEYLELRFGGTIRLWAVVLFLYMRFVWLGLIIYSAGTAVAEMTADTAPTAVATLTGDVVRFETAGGWRLFVLIATGVTATIYTTLGGIKAVIWTDVIQFIVLFLGAVVTLLIVMLKTGTGPGAWLHEATTMSHQLPPLFSFDPRTRTTIVAVVFNGLLWHVCTHASDQVALQRYFCTDSARSARRTAAVNFACDAAMSILLSLVGLALLAYYQRNTGELPPAMADAMHEMLAHPENITGKNSFADKVFPWFIAHGMPIGLCGLVVAGVFAVAQSSIDSGINSTCTVVMVDLIRQRRKTDWTEQRELHWAQVLTLLIGALVTLIAVAAAEFGRLSSIMELQLQSFNAVLGPLGAVFMLGFLAPRVNQASVLMGALAGAVVGLALGFWAPLDVWLTGLAGVQSSVLGLPVSPFWIIPLSWLTTLTIAWLASRFLGQPAPHQIQGLTFWSVRRREERIPMV